MLNLKIKEATKNGHQELEKNVIFKLKAIENNLDYADVLKYFYAYFKAAEAHIEAALPSSLAPYFATRRNASHIEKDIVDLGGKLDNLPEVASPDIENKNQAIGALYVLEGSIMGGPHIVKMLQHRGITTGFNFFNGYGDKSQDKWAEFTAIINQEVADEDHQQAIDAALATFAAFTNTFNSKSVLS
ncbi:heme oxygenase [Sphingobacterium faecium NBRC 15299]|jgi:heme oxygenase|uniref:biliverdin-producing heme oxygenase n=1 Tax=Sphingobacterium faecium TaxID=34087 RepID=UPI000D3D89A1|nr:biliverdin-producing heme oxygenase [Sphingobacterium faecium]PTX09549.1 heme oxygenase [Sphingobacterium faecium]GEM63831.1 heme oxygenase [Sphingobacterium faecium NBRC 15299]